MSELEQTYYNLMKCKNANTILNNTLQRRKLQFESIVLDAAKYGFDYRDNSQHQGEVPKGNILQWLQWRLEQK